MVTTLEGRGAKEQIRYIEPLEAKESFNSSFES